MMLKPFVMYERANWKINELRGRFEVDSVMVRYFHCDMTPYYRITLYPGTGASVVISHSYRHDEGSNHMCIVVTESTDDEGNPCWLYESSDSGNDCDGYNENECEAISYGDPNPNYDPTYLPTMRDQSHLLDAASWTRDHTAEAAGY